MAVARINMRVCPNTLAAYTSPDLIVSALSTRSMATVIAELCSVLAHAGKVRDPLALYEAALRREKTCSTALAQGWALPHARLPQLDDLSFALGRTETDLHWPCGQRVRMVFLFAVPEAGAATYLSIVSGLASLSRNPQALDRLLLATGAEEICDVFRKVQLRQPHRPSVRN